MDLSPFYYSLPKETFTRVEKDRDPLAPSYYSSRAVGSGTGGIYVTFDVETAQAETKDRGLNDPVLYKIQCTKEVQVLDLAKYCLQNGIKPEDCYAGSQSLNKQIHIFYGLGVQAMSWPSNQRPQGTSAVLLVDNIPGFKNSFQFIEVKK